MACCCEDRASWECQAGRVKADLQCAAVCVPARLVPLHADAVEADSVGTETGGGAWRADTGVGTRQLASPGGVAAGFAMEGEVEEVLEVVALVEEGRPEEDVAVSLRLLLVAVAVAVEEGVGQVMVAEEAQVGTPLARHRLFH